MFSDKKLLISDIFIDRNDCVAKIWPMRYKRILLRG